MWSYMRSDVVTGWPAEALVEAALRGELTKPPVADRGDDGPAAGMADPAPRPSGEPPRTGEQRSRLNSLGAGLAGQWQCHWLGPPP